MLSIIFAQRLNAFMPRTEYREQPKSGRSEKLSEELILSFSETF